MKTARRALRTTLIYKAYWPIIVGLMALLGRLLRTSFPQSGLWSDLCQFAIIALAGVAADRFSMWLESQQ